MKRKLWIAALALIVPLGAAGVLVAHSIGSPDQSCRTSHSAVDVGLDHPMGAVWSAAGLYVADTENGSVKKLHPDGTVVARWEGFERPVAVALSPEGSLYVADFLADQVVRIGPAGTVDRRWGRTGRGPGEFDAPSGIAVGPDGSVYVADFYNHRIQRFTADGRFLAAWGGRGIRNGRFRYPAGLAVDEGGRLFVADAFNHRVQVFGPDGRYRHKWGGLGYGLGGGWPGWFRVAKEIAIDPEGDVYVADAFNGRVQKFAPDGTLLAIWSGASEGTPLDYPTGVAVAESGEVHVLDFFDSRLSTFRCR